MQPSCLVQADRGGQLLINGRHSPIITAISVRGATADLSHRYLWGPAVDQLLAAEQVTSLSSAGNVIWPLADQIGTIRDLASHNSSTNTTTIDNHRFYDSFGNLVSETSSAVDEFFAYTGRMFDEATGLQNNLNRWYDPHAGRWISEDPSGFDGGDTNLNRYVGNSPTNFIDPSGLWGNPITGIMNHGYNLGNLIGEGLGALLGLPHKIDINVDAARIRENAAVEDFAYGLSSGSPDLLAQRRLRPLSEFADDAMRVGNGLGAASELTADVIAIVQVGGALRSAAGALGRCGAGASSKPLFGPNSVGAAQRPIPTLPSNARTADIGTVYKNLAKNHGIPQQLASKRLHELKQALGYAPDDDLLFDLTGNIFDPRTRQWLGSMTQGGARASF